MLSWLEGAFQTVLNMSIAAAVIIAAVLLARLLLRRAPKSFSYALWAVVLFRLLCPVSVSSAVSLLGLLDAPAQENTQYTTVIEYYAPPAVPQLSAPPVSVAAPPAVSEPVTGGGTAGGQAGAAGVGTGETAAIVWALGVCAMLIYGTASYIRLRRSLVGNIALEGNIHLADGINSPFVLGIFRPKIYLPSDICEGERDYIVLHERQHIRRGDHVLKALDFIALSLHWFNPLVWLAFVLAGRDMEMSCDEAVLKRLGEGVRADYSASLLRFASGRRGALSVPLAFGESGIKGRIKNLLRWKRPRAWISAAAALLCAVVLAACAVNPAADDGPARGEYGTAEDIGYCLELAASADGVEFGDMDAEILQQIIDAHYSMTDGQAILARESTDGQSAYVFWLNTGAKDSFTEVESTAVRSGGTILEPGGSMESGGGSNLMLTRLNTQSGAVIFIEPGNMDFTGLRGVHSTYCQYGPEYIDDALSRGIALYSSSQTGLIAYYSNERFGTMMEILPLSSDGAEAILLSGERAPIDIRDVDPDGIVAALLIDGEAADIYTAESGIPQSARELIIEHCGYDPCAEPAVSVTGRGEYGTAEDMAYCMELTSGSRFEDMDAEILQQILDAKPDRIRIEGEVVLARMSADGRSAYVFLLDEGAEDDFTGYEDALIAAGVTLLEPGGSLERDPDSTTTLARVNTSNGTVLLLGEDRPGSMGNFTLYNTYGTYLRGPDRPDYFEDAVARGISFDPSAVDNALSVAYIHPEFGTVSEMIPLTQEQAEEISASDRVSLALDETQFLAVLAAEGETADIYMADTGISAAALEIIRAHCPVDPTAAPGQTESPLPAAPEGYGTAEDMAYYFELAASASGVEFRDMDAETVQRITSSIMNHSNPAVRFVHEGEAIVARESTDGRSAYVFWLDEGMEDNFTEVERTAILSGVTMLEPGGDAEYHEGSDISAVCEATPNGTIILIEPEDMEFSGLRGLRDIYTGSGPAYMADAVSRGVSLYLDGDYYLSAGYINDSFGAVVEHIALSEAEAAQIQSDSRMAPVTAANGTFMAALSVRGGAGENYNADTGIPQSALELIIGHCNYDPSGA